MMFGSAVIIIELTFGQAFLPRLGEDQENKSGYTSGINQLETFAVIRFGRLPVSK